MDDLLNSVDYLIFLLPNGSGVARDNESER